MRWMLLFMALACGTANSRTLICIPEAAATVISTTQGFESGSLETKIKFILSDASGKWVVKIHPQNLDIFTNCEDEYFCDAEDSFAGAFFREKDERQKSKFTAFWMTADNSSRSANSAKGYCTEL